MAILTHRERKIICDLCYEDLTDYSTHTARQLRKEWNVKRIDSKDYCENCCNPNIL